MRKQKQPLNYYATVAPEVGAWIEAEVARRGAAGRRGASATIVAELLLKAVRAEKATGAPLAAPTTPTRAATTDDDDGVDFDRSKL